LKKVKKIPWSAGGPHQRRIDECHRTPNLQKLWQTLKTHHSDIGQSQAHTSAATITVMLT